MSGKKQKWLERNIGAFLQRYARKSQPGIEPNDRRYDRRIEKRLKRLPPEEFDRIMHGDDDASERERTDASESDAKDANVRGTK